MKNSPIIAILIIIGIFAGFGVYAYFENIFSVSGTSLTAGWLSWLSIDSLGGTIDCVSEMAKCGTDAKDCKARVMETANKCENQYSRASEGCYRYQEKAGTFLPKCSGAYSACMIKASRYASNNDRYSYYLSKCAETNTRCESRARERQNTYINKANDCMRKAGEKREACKDKYLGWQAKNLERCSTKMQRCVDRLQRKCGL
jgi:xanthosine utilization system XapX-like protein